MGKDLAAKKLAKASVVEKIDGDRHNKSSGEYLVKKLLLSFSKSSTYISESVCRTGLMRNRNCGVSILVPVKKVRNVFESFKFRLFQWTSELQRALMHCQSAIAC